MKPHQSFWFGSLSFFWLVATSPMQAQIVGDTTLPNSSIVTPNGDINVITGGTQVETNLFHSFQEFSVPTGGTASFRQIDQGIENVISRVTGSSFSNIDGLIEVLQSNRTVSSANFFLLNPNGIIFGPKATLAIGGSFLASTASSLNFADGTAFNATNSQTTALLTVSVPIGLQFGGPARSIQVQGGLQVPFGKMLGLVGGELTLFGGGLRAAGGRVELGSVAGVVTPDLAPVQVSLTPIDQGWALGYEKIQNFQDIHLSRQATVTASGSGGGDIQVQGRRVTVTDGSRIITNTLGAGSGGTLSVTASESVEISGSVPNRFSGLFAQVISPATGTGGNLTIETRQLLIKNGAQVTTLTDGSGKAGNLTVRAADLVEVRGTSDDLKTRSSLGATVQRGLTGDGGDLTIETKRLTVLDGAQVLTSTFGAGKSGNLTVQNATEVELVGGTVIADGEFWSSGLFTQTGAEATGDGGNLSISAEKLIVRDGAQVNSATLGVGRAGDLTVRATEVELVGAAISADGKLLTNKIGLPFPSGLIAGNGIRSTGNGGTLTVETDRLSLRDGAVLQTSTLGEGDAGNLAVLATDSVELIGTAKGSQFPTSLLAVSGGIPELPGIVEATGRGGNLKIETGDLIVQDGAAVAVGSFNPEPDAKGAGTLEVQAQTIRLDNQGELTSATASGQGGDIKLDVQDLLLLSRNSDISSSAGIAGAGGDGGNITIETPFIVAVPSQDSDITANAFEGNGGNIRIRASDIFGIQFQQGTPQSNDITASSEFGVDGVVEINTPDVDASRALFNLPAQPVDTEVAQVCTPSRNQNQQQQSEFVITGRGGLPDTPNEALSSDAIQVDWVTLNPKVENSSSSVSTNPLNPPPTQIVEAQGWVINNNGEVVLTAQAPTVTPHNSWQALDSCGAS